MSAASADMVVKAPQNPTARPYWTQSVVSILVVAQPVIAASKKLPRMLTVRVPGMERAWVSVNLASVPRLPPMAIQSDVLSCSFIGTL